MMLFVSNVITVQTASCDLTTTFMMLLFKINVQIDSPPPLQHINPTNRTEAMLFRSFVLK